MKLKDSEQLSVEVWNIMVVGADGTRSRSQHLFSQHVSAQLSSAPRPS
ncbi:MAG: hypothetical protein WAN89_02675 [Lawsonella sp.]|nr:hypothetical protein [Mycobacteriales bacterium]